MEKSAVQRNGKMFIMAGMHWSSLFQEASCPNQFELKVEDSGFRSWSLGSIANLSSTPRMYALGKKVKIQITLRQKANNLVLRDSSFRTQL